MKQVLSHKVPGHPEPSNLASLTTNNTFLLENDEASADTETIKANSVSDASLIATPVYHDTSQYTPRKGSRWSLLFERIVSRKKSQLGTLNETIKSQQDMVPWNSKTLILGTSESGKSTLYKSLMLQVEGSFTLEERQSFKEIIFTNAVQSMRVVLEAMEGLGISLEDDRNEFHVQKIFMQPSQLEVEKLPTEAVDTIETLYTDSGVRECLKRTREYQIPDVAE